MSSSAPFPGRSVAAVFSSYREAGMDPRKLPAFHNLVSGGMDPDTPVELLGWIDNPDERRAIAATLPFPSFAAAAPNLMAGDTSKDALIYKAWKDVLGKYPGYVAQQIGDCTSFGSGHCLDLLQCVEIATGTAIEFRETCTEAIYGMGREVGDMLGGGDGCYGVAVAKAVSEWGVTTREKVGPYSGQRAKQWGRSGVPAEVKESALPFKGTVTTLITTLDELDAALANGYPSAGGFGEGFSMHRDADGVCRKQGRWGHEVMCGGKRTRSGNRQYLLVQSWGPNVPDGPTTDDQPDFSFWIDERDMLGILEQRDWLTFGIFGGFVRKDLPSEWSWEGMA